MTPTQLRALIAYVESRGSSSPNWRAEKRAEMIDAFGFEEDENGEISAQGEG